MFTMNSGSDILENTKARFSAWLYAIANRGYEATKNNIDS